MAVLKTFELQGNKKSCANWISNLSPCDTPFTSMIGKESINQSQYSWQADVLSPADNSAYEEGSEVGFRGRVSTHVLTNFTSILRKVVHVSDTAETVDTYGRGSETAYQMSKGGKEILRDLEYMNLHQKEGNPGSATLPGRFYGFQGMCSDIGDEDADTGAITHHKVDVFNVKGPWFKQSDIFEVTYNLYLSGSKANIIMFHPKHTSTFSTFINYNAESDHVYRMFDNLDSKFNAQVKRIKDPLGRVYTLVPNRFMPENRIYFFNPEDWTQMVLRAPSATKLSKTGSSERYMIEMEMGLRHRHIFASGILTMIPANVTVNLDDPDQKLTAFIDDESGMTLEARVNGQPLVGSDVTWTSSDESVFIVHSSEFVTNEDGTALTFITPVNPGEATLTITVGDIEVTTSISVGLPTITLQAAPAEIAVGDTSTISATVRDVSGSLVSPGVKVDWKATPSANANIPASSVTNTQGIATARAVGLLAGAVEISASVGGSKVVKTALNITDAVGP